MTEICDYAEGLFPTEQSAHSTVGLSNSETVVKAESVGVAKSPLDRGNPVNNREPVITEGGVPTEMRTENSVDRDGIHRDRDSARRGSTCRDSAREGLARTSGRTAFRQRCGAQDGSAALYLSDGQYFNEDRTRESEQVIIARREYAAFLVKKASCLLASLGEVEGRVAWLLEDCLDLLEMETSGRGVAFGFGVPQTVVADDVGGQGSDLSLVEGTFELA